MSAANAFAESSMLQVQRNTGFAPGLYSGAELDAKAIQVDPQLAEPCIILLHFLLASPSCFEQDKEGKMAYLQKMIDCISNTLGEQVLAKPAKVRTRHHQCKRDHHQ